MNYVCNPSDYDSLDINDNLSKKLKETEIPIDFFINEKNLREYIAWNEAKFCKFYIYFKQKLWEPNTIVYDNMSKTLSSPKKITELFKQNKEIIKKIISEIEDISLSYFWEGLVIVLDTLSLSKEKRKTKMAAQKQFIIEAAKVLEKEVGEGPIAFIVLESMGCDIEERYWQKSLDAFREGLQMIGDITAEEIKKRLKKKQRVEEKAEADRPVSDFITEENTRNIFTQIVWKSYLNLSGIRKYFRDTPLPGKRQQEVLEIASSPEKIIQLFEQNKEIVVKIFSEMNIDELLKFKKKFKKVREGSYYTLGKLRWDIEREWWKGSAVAFDKGLDMIANLLEKEIEKKKIPFPKEKIPRWDYSETSIIELLTSDVLNGFIDDGIEKNIFKSQDYFDIIRNTLYKSIWINTREDFWEVISTKELWNINKVLNKVWGERYKYSRLVKFALLWERKRFQKWNKKFLDGITEDLSSPENINQLFEQNKDAIRESFAKLERDDLDQIEIALKNMYLPVFAPEIENEAVLDEYLLDFRKEIEEKWWLEAVNAFHSWTEMLIDLIEEARNQKAYEKIPKWNYLENSIMKLLTKDVVKDLFNHEYFVNNSYFNSQSFRIYDLFINDLPKSIWALKNSWDSWSWIHPDIALQNDYEKWIYKLEGNKFFNWQNRVLEYGKELLSSPENVKTLFEMHKDTIREELSWLDKETLEMHREGIKKEYLPCFELELKGKHKEIYDKFWTSEVDKYSGEIDFYYILGFRKRREMTWWKEVVLAYQWWLRMLLGLVEDAIAEKEKTQN